MKNTTKVCIGLFGLSLLLLTTAFGYKYKPQVLVDKFGSTEPCNSMNKSSNGTKVAYTQSAHDQLRQVLVMDVIQVELQLQ